MKPPTLEFTETSNGLRLVFETVPSMMSTFAVLVVASGSRDDPPTDSGVSHCIEHLVFRKGVNGSGSKSFKEIESLGAELNAFTAKEFIFYYVRLLSKYTSQGLEAFFRLFLSPDFDPNSLSAEKNTVMSEMKSYHDSIEDVIEDDLFELAWKNHPLGYREAGRPTTVRGLTTEAVQRFYRDQYVAKNMCLIVLGPDQKTKIKKAAEDFASVLRKRTAPKVRKPPKFVSGTQFEKRPISGFHIGVGLKGVPFDDDRREAFDVLADILGYGLQSRLYKKLRQESGLCYYLKADQYSYSDAGLLRLFTGTQNAYASKVLNLINSELDGASAGDVTDEELRRAKNISLSKTATQHESPERRLTNLAESIACTGTALQTEEKFRRIKSVTRRDVQQLLAHSELISRAIYTIGTALPSHDFKRGSSEVELVAS